MNHLLNIARQFKPVQRCGAPPGLPVYQWKRQSDSVFYTPGLVAVVKKERVKGFEYALLGRSSSAVSGEPTELASRMRVHAEQAVRLYERFYQSPYQPECLTLSVRDRCSLDCTYCLRTGAGYSGNLSPVDAAKGAAIVARNCRRKNIRMTVVFHGWGEPTQDFPLLKELVKVVNAEAHKAGVLPFRYIATNGVFSPEVAEYLGRSFDLVGLSCDGPPEIQDRQRKLGTSGSSRFVEQTASILRRNGVPVSVRATITRHSMKRQDEIARYILEVFRPAEIHFEPVYRRPEEFAGADPETLYTHFQKAQAIASQQNVPLTLSGSRIAEIHGPYCHIFRNVLNLVPGGHATVCFADTTGTVNDRIATRGAGAFAIDRRKLRNLRQILSRTPQKCRHCLNGFHCAGSCPDSCRLNSEGGNPQETFRCRVQLVSTVTQILKSAKEIEPMAQSSAGHAWRSIGIDRSVNDSTLFAR
jgi:sulfatase maturation enzyme AslB (radical SAM superfamily)